MSAPVAMVQVCTEFDAGGVCTDTAWMPYASGAFPYLSIEAAQEIALAMAGLWALAWAIRMIKRTLLQSS